ncbi:hypothetical protein G6L68_25120 [Agrobacterium fabrum]|uniref:hypothetical protein n=1 Tax=Agrobacterium fabrum TaxID=1176649 RepID=UPI000EF5DC73|nr:hypothetical protein [Agrobacterium fabrum]AYM66168.1 hypothetical protein At12D13_50160 [Agrobacterium fabrum]NTE63915.1 hypothetical protein [Agrobacterium fabrum]
MSDATQSRSLRISPKYTVAFWRGLELDADNPKQEDWLKAVDVLRDRIQSRFIKPAQTLIDGDKASKEYTSGFAILALDCLVIETIEGFRQGVTNHSGQSTRLFKAFLSSWPPFVACLGAGMVAETKAEEFYKQGRCALHHSGATEKMTVGISGPMMQFDNDQITVNRTTFHAELETEFNRYLETLSNPASVDLRKKFLQKMNPICGI